MHFLSHRRIRQVVFFVLHKLLFFMLQKSFRRCDWATQKKKKLKKNGMTQRECCIFNITSCLNGQKARTLNVQITEIFYRVRSKGCADQTEHQTFECAGGGDERKAAPHENKIKRVNLQIYEHFRGTICYSCFRSGVEKCILCVYRIIHLVIH